MESESTGSVSTDLVSTNKAEDARKMEETTKRLPSQKVASSNSRKRKENPVASSNSNKRKGIPRRAPFY